jgi:hypothetical protein
VVDQYLYPLDPPESFVRDTRKGSLDRSDLKVSELTWVGGDVLAGAGAGFGDDEDLRIDLAGARSIAPEHLTSPRAPRSRS